MTLAMSITFNGYTFPRTISPIGLQEGIRVPSVVIPRADGQRMLAVADSVDGTLPLKPITIQFQGSLRGDTAAALESAHDGLVAALQSGEAYLTLWNDRQIKARLADFTTDYDPTSLRRYCFIAFSMLALNPLWESTATEQHWHSPVSGTVYTHTAQGNACGPASVNVYVPASGVDVALTVTLNGRVFTITAPAASWTGGWVMVDGEAETVTAMDPTQTSQMVTQAVAMGWFEGEWPKVKPGTNSISVVTTNTVDTLQLQHKGWWY